MAKKSGYPRRGEVVIGTVTKVNPFSANVRLDEYDKEGMIHISEVARRWIKDIRKALKRNQKVVAVVRKVDKDHIFLSTKRVSKFDSEKKLKEYKRELKGEKMLRVVAKDLGLELDDSYKKFGFRLKEEFGELFKAFQECLDEEGYKEVEKLTDKKTAKSLKKVAERFLEAKNRKIKGILNMTSYAPDGVKIIKNILKDIEKEGIEVKYVSAPNYSISVETKKPKEGSKKIEAAAEIALKKIKKTGEGSFELC